MYNVRCTHAQLPIIFYHLVLCDIGPKTNTDKNIQVPGTQTANAYYKLHMNI